jgi:NitT/TauT family transport system substrate-binding protein
MLGACVPAARTVEPTQPPAGQAPSTTEPAATAEPVSLKVGILSYMSNSPFFIAQEEGYFAEQGLDVHLVDFGFTEREMVPATLKGDIDVMGVAMTVGLLAAVEQGANIRYVADKGFANPDGCASDAFIASKALLESGALVEPADLLGRKVVAFTGNALEYTFDLLLERAGLTANDLQLDVLFDPAVIVQGLEAGSIDVTMAGEPWITRARRSGAAEVWLPYSDVIPNVSVAGVVYGPSMLERPEDLGVRFMVAYLKAVDQFLHDRSERTVDIISQYTKLPPEEIKQVCWNSMQPDGLINEQGLAGFLEWAQAKGYTDTAVSVDQVWDPRFVERARERIGR